MNTPVSNTNEGNIRLLTLSVLYTLASISSLYANVSIILCLLLLCVYIYILIKAKKKIKNQSVPLDGRYKYQTDLSLIIASIGTIFLSIKTIKYLVFLFGATGIIGT